MESGSGWHSAVFASIARRFSGTTYQEKVVPEKSAPESPKPVAPKPGGASPPKTPPVTPVDAKPRLRYCDYLFCWVDKAYRVKCAAPVDTFDGFRGYFHGVAKSLKIFPENRW